MSNIVRIQQILSENALYFHEIEPRALLPYLNHLHRHGYVLIRRHIAKLFQLDFHTYARIDGIHISRQLTFFVGEASALD